MTSSGNRADDGGARAPLDVDASRAAWLEARTFDDLCRLGGRFVAGELTFFPGWNAPDLDEESDAIATTLIELHRGGFLTVASQPASPVQHAFVAGFVGPALAARLATLDGRDGLVVAVFAEGSTRASRPEPVSFHDGVAHAFAGHDARADEIVCFEDHVSASALQHLRSASYVSAHDTHRGRVDTLWTALRRALVPT